LPLSWDIGQVTSRNFDWLSFTLSLVTFSGPSIGIRALERIGEGEVTEAEMNGDVLRWRRLPTVGGGSDESYDTRADREG
jgi:hypothetical protein